MTNDANAIAATLKELNFLVASKICLFPLFENGTFKYTAYIRIAEWIDCDAAYNVVKAMKDGKNTVAYISKTQQLWELSKTAPADICHTEDQKYEKWTTEFNRVDSDTESDYSDYEMDADTISRVEYVEPALDFAMFSYDIRKSKLY